MTAMPLLVAKGLEARCGLAQVLFGVDVELHAGEVAALVDRFGEPFDECLLQHDCELQISARQIRNTPRRLEREACLDKFAEIP